MTREDVDVIQEALTEMGLMLTDIVDYDTKPLWTLHQRKLYEHATFVLNEERKAREYGTAR